jgi:hypothetical protein
MKPSTATDLLLPSHIESDFNVHSCELEVEKRLASPADHPMDSFQAFRAELVRRKA